MSTEAQMDEQNVIDTYSGHCSALKTKEILTHTTTGMNFRLSDVSQSQKDKHHMSLHT